MNGLRQTARHEAAHAYAAETLGIPVGWATVKRDGDACGHVTPADLWPKHPATLTVMLAAYHSAKARGDAPEGHEGDFDQAEHFATLLADSEEEATRLWREAHIRAAELVRAPEWEHVTHRIAAALLDHWERGFGLLPTALGEVIAEARAEHAQSQRLYGMPAPRETLTGCTPSEELAKRNAMIAELKAEEAKRPRTTTPRSSHKPHAGGYRPNPADWLRVAAGPARPAVDPGTGAVVPKKESAGFKARRSFTITINGHAYHVAENEWVAAGHELVAGLK